MECRRICFCSGGEYAICVFGLLARLFVLVTSECSGCSGGGGELFLSALEVIRQYDSCNTGELDRHAQHRQPCLASRTLRVIVRQEQPVLSGTHWSLFVHRQMSVVLCLRRFPMKQAEA